MVLGVRRRSAAMSLMLSPAMRERAISSASAASMVPVATASVYGRGLPRL
jgi:hypothetical protein